MKLIQSLGRSFLDFLPLIVFLQVAEHNHELGVLKWLIAFEIAGLLSAFHIILLLLRKPIANRVILGIDFYLLIGGTASFFSIFPLLLLLESYKEFSMLIAICAVGCMATFFSPKGFIGCEATCGKTFPLSLLLLIIAVVVSIFSYFFIGNTLLSGVVPIAIIITFNKIFIAVCSKDSTPTG